MIAKIKKRPSMAALLNYSVASAALAQF